MVIFFNNLSNGFSPAISKLEKDNESRHIYDYISDFKEMACLAVPVTIGRIINSLMISAEQSSYPGNWYPGASPLQRQHLYMDN